MSIIPYRSKQINPQSQYNQTHRRRKLPNQTLGFKGCTIARNELLDIIGLAYVYLAESQH